VTSDSLRLVVVDDEPDVLLLLRLQLSALPGLDVVGTAVNGEDAVEVCRKERPDAVVMDLLMPVSSGFHAIEALQQEHPGIVIVAYTAVAGEYVRSEMERLGVPLILKSGDVRPLVDALFAGARAGED
jgi:two-component system, NarL family, nitrate/nitrite response regulator NarL